jgi:hypothetical protein
MDMLHNFKSSYIQLNNQTAVLSHGHAHMTKGQVGKNTLTKPTEFHIYSLKTEAPSKPAIFNLKSFNSTHFGDIQDEYNNIVSITNDTTSLLLVGNGKVINFTGDSINSPKLQSLIGMAVKKKQLDYREKDHHDLVLMQD